MNRQYYQLTKANNTATINIYGDITSYPWSDSDVSANNLSQILDNLGDVSNIFVYINSYGGEVAEGLAIYNALKRHKAKVTTYCDGFACSIASVIFMAGEERVMNDSSLLMIHNAWSMAMGNAKELRKQADDLDKITQASVTAYKAHSTLSEAEIVEMMDAETWILPEEAIEYGFATDIETTESEKASQNAKRNLLELVKMSRKASEEETEEEPVDPDDEEEPAEPETEGEDESEEDEAEPEVEEEEPEEEEDSEEEEDPEEDEEQEKAAQRWSGFFNAFLKIERRNEK
jgi:ATP-dependent Clp protease protease subunit